MPTSEADKAYAAGLFDGEGCVVFGRARGGHFISIMVTNTDRAALEWLKRRFGGDVQSKLHKNKRWKASSYWRLSWSKAVEFLDAIHPWLKIRNRQAELAFAWDAIRPGSGKRTKAETSQHADAVELLMQELRWLNQKGPNERISPIEEHLVAGGIHAS